MPAAQDIQWFKQTFGPQILQQIANTPFTADMITAIACQETGYIWARLRRLNKTVPQITALCNGDTIDAKPNGKGRSAFPKNKADLLASPRGRDMFAIARTDLEALANLFNDFKPAAQNPDKFCRGFGVFQYDLQYFKTTPEYFLRGEYRDFDLSLKRCLQELKRGLARLNWQNKVLLTDDELAAIAIVYNSGRYVPSKGLKQGHMDSEGRYYGEKFYDYLRLAHKVTDGGAINVVSGRATLAASVPLENRGSLYRVETLSSTLRLREDPRISKPLVRNVIAEMPEGHLVRSVQKKKGDFLEVETNLGGARLKAFANSKYLKPTAVGAAMIDAVPANADPQSGVVAVYMPSRPGTVTKRSEFANAHSLNERGQPGRRGTTAAELRKELGSIVDWLAVDKEQHKRYQPRSGLTFCNIYAHDYCHLAGVYLPRVWWTSRAIAALMQGNSIEPLYGNTIDEQRANDLFRWLRDFGLDFGWRRSVSLDEVQTEVNQGAVGIIVARRREDGRSGHIVMVVPETDELTARRDASGKVVAPLQSQAGSTNFRYGRGGRDWWKGPQFAESAFWLHA